MPGWGWILVVVAVLIMAAAVVAAMLASRRRRRRSDVLREHFGPEYERTLKDADDRKHAEAELERRLDRRQQLDVVPLSPQATERYTGLWQKVQTDFVDAPEAAVASAEGLITAVMRERGYPVDDFEQRAADVSVDHPRVVENYRSAREIADRSRDGKATTEDLRQAMHHYRALFEELLETGDDEAIESSARRDDGSGTSSARDTAAETRS